MNTQELITLSRQIVENEGRVGARGATLELARGYLALAEAYEFDVAIPLAELRQMLNELGVPNENYPAPVANAVRIGTAALAAAGTDTP